METLELSRAELWFCAPDTPAKGEAQEFTLRTGKMERRLWVRLVPSVLPPLQKESSAFELFVQEDSEREPGAVLRCDGTLYLSDKQVEDIGQWRRCLAKTLAGRMTRVWLPENDARFGISLHPNGGGAVWGRNTGSNRFSTTPFNWGPDRPEQSFAWWTQDEFNTFFSVQWNDLSSPLRRAFEWHGWSEDQRTAHVLRCENGTWDELRQIAQSVLMLYLLEDDEIELGWEDTYWFLFDQNPFAPDSALLEKWEEVLLRVFSPLGVRDDVPSSERSHFYSLDTVFPRRPQSAPSAHEKLEAHLHLKGWLERNAPDEAARLLDFSP